MQKARENQKEKVDLYVKGFTKISPLKLTKKAVSETDDSSAGSPRKKVKKIIGPWSFPFLLNWLYVQTTEKFRTAFIFSWKMGNMEVAYFL